MALTDKQLNGCFQILRESTVPVGLTNKIMNNIYCEKEEIRISNNFRWAMVFSIGFLIFTLTTYSTQQKTEKIIVGYHSYMPKSYSEKVALSKEKITENTIFCMITEN